VKCYYCCDCEALLCLHPKQRCENCTPDPGSCLASWVEQSPPDPGELP